MATAEGGATLSSSSGFLIKEGCKSSLITTVSKQFSLTIGSGEATLFESGDKFSSVSEAACSRSYKLVSDATLPSQLALDSATGLLKTPKNYKGAYTFGLEVTTLRSADAIPSIVTLSAV